MRRFKSSFDSNLPDLEVTSPSTTIFLGLGKYRSGSKPPARSVSHEIAVNIHAVEEDVGYGFGSALRNPARAGRMLGAGLPELGCTQKAPDVVGSKWWMGCRHRSCSLPHALRGQNACNLSTGWNYILAPFQVSTALKRGESLWFSPTQPGRTRGLCACKLAATIQAGNTISGLQPQSRRRILG